MRAFWHIAGSVMFASTVAWGGYNIAALLGHSERDEVRVYSAADVTLIDVHDSTGGVTVTGTDAATASGKVTVMAHISDGIRGTQNSQQIVDGVLRLRASCPILGSMWCGVRYTIEVPHDMAVRLRSDNDGIYVNDITGSVDASSDNGSIRAAGLTSPTARFSSDNGSVHAQFDAAPSSVVARSDNGDITIAVPAEGAYSVKVSTDNGSTHVNVTDDPSSSRTIDAATDNGSITVRYND
jgi:hypothetical protein